jgi:hypothetical protein
VCVVASGWGKVPFSHLENPRQSVLIVRRKLHSSQLDLARSRRRSGGQEESDMKCSVIVISLVGGMVPDPAEGLVFEPEDAALLGELFGWVGPPAGPEGAAAVEVEPAGAGVKPTLEDI